MDKHNTTLIDILYTELDEIDIRLKKTDNKQILKVLNDRRKGLVKEIVDYKLKQYEWRNKQL